ncbi:MAG: hypothetical protein WCE25_11295 [Nitrososphaeraceae archaeon]
MVGKVKTRYLQIREDCSLKKGGSAHFIVCEHADIEKASSGAVKVT